MYNQFTCHRDFVKWNNVVKTPWRLKYGEPAYQDFYHLEPGRNDRGYWGFVNVSCNGDQLDT
jgi:hypothetical protein